MSLWTNSLRGFNEIIYRYIPCSEMNKKCPESRFSSPALYNKRNFLLNLFIVMNFVSLSLWDLFLWIQRLSCLSIIVVVVQSLVVRSIHKGKTIVDSCLLPVLPNDSPTCVGTSVSLQLYFQLSGFSDAKIYLVV